MSAEHHALFCLFHSWLCTLVKAVRPASCLAAVAHTSSGGGGKAAELVAVQNGVGGWLLLWWHMLSCWRHPHPCLLPCAVLSILCSNLQILVQNQLRSPHAGCVALLVLLSILLVSGTILLLLRSLLLLLDAVAAHALIHSLG